MRFWAPNRADVLVCDIGLPGEDGYTLIRQVRARDAASGGCIPALALSAYTRATDRQQALAAGFQEYLHKPIDPAGLVRAIELLARGDRPDTAVAWERAG